MWSYPAWGVAQVLLKSNPDDSNHTQHKKLLQWDPKHKACGLVPLRV